MFLYKVSRASCSSGPISVCDITADEMKQAIEAGYDPFDGVTVSPVIEAVYHPEVPANNATTGSTTEAP